MINLSLPTCMYLQYSYVRRYMIITYLVYTYSYFTRAGASTQYIMIIKFDNDINTQVYYSLGEYLNTTLGCNNVLLLHRTAIKWQRLIKSRAQCWWIKLDPNHPHSSATARPVAPYATISNHPIQQHPLELIIRKSI